MNTLKADLRRALISWNFVAAAGVLGLILVLSPSASLRAVFSGEADVSGQIDYGAALCMEAMQGKAFLSAVPIAAALPFTAAFAEDLETHFGKLYLPRSGRSAYVRARVGAAALSGGAAVCLGELLALAVLIALLSPATAGPEPEGTAASAPLLAAAWLGRLLLSFLSGALYALIGLLAGVVSETRFMAWTTPFVSYYLLVILTERYLPFLYVLDPDEWIAPGPVWQAELIGPAVITAEFTVILAVISAVAMRRRLRNV